MSTTSSVDVVVVGAGAAGLAAAKTARDLGLDVVVFEAMARVGGRAYTDPRPFGVPWDVGCHWLHSADINPFTRLADDYGFRYRSRPTPWLIDLGGRWASPAEEVAIDGYLDAAAAAAVAAGAAGRDISLAEVVDPDNAWFWVWRLDVNAEWGADPANVSTLDVARYRDTDQNWPVEDGYGALVARYGAGQAVELATSVERIDWGGERVRVTTGKGTVEAATAIVTVSTGVLAANVIRFEPALPVWKQAAIAAVPLGAANKVGLQIDGRQLGVDEDTYVVVPVGDGAAISLQLRPFGWDLASAYLAGPLCSELERAGPAAMIDVVLGALRSIVGSDVGRHVRATAASRWESEPYVRGAYAAAVPGRAGLRDDLARPLGDRLFFAGEATSPEFFATCHGAYLTGIATAKLAATLLGRP